METKFDEVERLKNFLFREGIQGKVKVIKNTEEEKIVAFEGKKIHGRFGYDEEEAFCWVCSKERFPSTAEVSFSKNKERLLSSWLKRIREGEQESL